MSEMSIGNTVWNIKQKLGVKDIKKKNSNCQKVFFFYKCFNCQKCQTPPKCPKCQQF